MLVDNLIKVVIDTSVLIRALMAEQGISGKKKLDPKRDAHAPLIILRQFESGSKLILMVNSAIFKEYSNKLNEKCREGSLRTDLVSKYLNLTGEKGTFDRLLVKPIITVDSDYNDTKYLMSQNCLYADYLITVDEHFTTIKDDLKQIRSQLKIVSPVEFLKETPKK